MDKIEYKFKVRNPYKPDETIIQKVLVSNSLQYDYSDSEWVSIDGEFTGLNMLNDRLCCVQIASPDDQNEEAQRIEIVYTYDQVIDTSLIHLLKSKTEKIFHVFSADIPMLSKDLKVDVSGPFFDTKVASKLIWTNSPNSGISALIKNFVDPKFEKVKQSHTRWELPPERWSDKMLEYASLDVLYLNPVRKRLTAMAKDRGREDLLASSMKALEHITKLYAEGFDVGIYQFN